MGVWALLGFLTVVLNENRSSLLPLGLPAAFVLLLVLYQELVMRQYWANTVGMTTLYLPVPGVRFRHTGGVTHIMSPVYVLSLLPFSAATLPGRFLGRGGEESANNLIFKISLDRVGKAV